MSLWILTRSIDPLIDDEDLSQQTTFRIRLPPHVDKQNQEFGLACHCECGCA
jgi:hypothetical protein